MKPRFREKIQIGKKVKMITKLKNLDRNIIWCSNDVAKFKKKCAIFLVFIIIIHNPIKGKYFNTIFLLQWNRFKGLVPIKRNLITLCLYTGHILFKILNLSESSYLHNRFLFFILPRHIIQKQKYFIRIRCFILLFTTEKTLKFCLQYLVVNLCPICSQNS